MLRDIRLSLIGLTAALAAIVLGWDHASALVQQRTAARVAMQPAPVEQTLEVRTLVQPELDGERPNARPRSDI